MNSNDEWKDQEKDAFEGLRREIDPGSDFDRRLWQRLRREGALHSSAATARSRGWPLQVAAAVIFFALGLGLGTWLPDAGQPRQADGRYMLLLLPGEAPASPASADRLVAEYGEWARDLRRQGRTATGERLAGGGPMLPSGQAEPEVPALEGFFIISASSPEAALDTARTHPHLRYGGRIALREIIATD